MKTLIVLVLVWGGINQVLAQEDIAQEPYWLRTTAAPVVLSDEASRHALEAFKQINFFAEGRGMHMSPGLITHFNTVMSVAPAPSNPNLDLRTHFTRRWGLNFQDGEVVGLFDEEYRGLRVGAVGCVACHSGKAAGKFIIGLGNKNIDVVRMASDVHRLETWWKWIVPDSSKSADYVDVEEAALQFSEYLSDEEIGNLTSGLVPISFIRGWFYRVHGMEYPRGLNRGQVKVPMLWGYEKKREVGLFCDGYGDGAEVGWAVAVELAAGQKPEVIRKVYDEVIKAEELFNEFLPPEYPFEIDEALTAEGQELFEVTCAKCHGTYEKDTRGHPIYKAPKHVPWIVVQTDRDRLEGNTEAFGEMVKASPLADIIKFTNLGDGYFAPRLEGVWSRFPYLHNASVPSIRALLSPPEERPRYFSLRDVGEEDRFSRKDLGLTVPKGFIEESVLALRAAGGSRTTYDTDRVGHSSQGHDFYTDLSDARKDALIEYLKTL